ncbi:hypothetical protein PQR64_11495 [Paraburkholderia phytofirmans]|uniref:hypothetical protein n=1 Tax=Paraburkholderia phytofirmans TaxID=261302 RepID=UPI0038B9EB25
MAKLNLIDSLHRVRNTPEVRRNSSNSLRDAPAEVPIIGDVRGEGMPTNMKPNRQSQQPHLLQASAGSRPAHCCTAS